MSPELLAPLVDPLLGPVAIPLVAAAVCVAIPQRWGAIRVVVAVLSATVAGLLAASHFFAAVPDHAFLAADPLSSLCSLAAAVVTVLVTVFMLGWAGDGTAPSGQRVLVAGVCASLGAANAVFFAESLLLLLLAWGAAAVVLYAMVAAAGGPAIRAARKAAMIVAGADAALLLGVVMLWEAHGEDVVAAEALGRADGLAFAVVAVAALAKLGAVPLHAWIGPVAKRAHAPTAALLVGAIDKLLGGYLLIRMVGDEPSTLLIAVGTVSIVIGMLMAITDRSAKGLLGASSIGQVGFILLGLGSGTAIGRAGALFHLVNNALYKPALFLTTEAVERRTGTSDLRRLGGLAPAMPWTFAATLVCGLALAGIPPLSGFFSKWMLYQGLFEARAHGGIGWAVGLLAAMAGSALTLAAVAKLIHATYLRKASTRTRTAVAKAGPRWRAALMAAPAALAAAACIALGLFADRLVLRPLVFPATEGEVTFNGTWWSGMAALLLVAAIGVGSILYFGAIGRVRRAPTYVGGEDLRRVRISGVPASADRDVEVSGAEFFATVTELAGLRRLYGAAQRGWLDAEKVASRILAGPIDLLRGAHSGVLTSYATWMVLGLCALLLFLGGGR